MRHFLKSESGCWNWTASTIKGYGQFYFRPTRQDKIQKLYAHRFAYELFVGPIPPGAIVRHSCDNPLCVNPDHLSIGTSQDNRSDMARRGRGLRSKSGLPYGVTKRRIVKDGGRAYSAAVTYRRKFHYVGSFHTAEEAAQAALDFKAKLYA